MLSTPIFSRAAQAVSAHMTRLNGKIEFWLDAPRAADEFARAFNDFPEAVDRMIKQRPALREQAANGNAEAAKTLKTETAGNLFAGLEHMAGRLLVREGRRSHISFKDIRLTVGPLDGVIHPEVIRGFSAIRTAVRIAASYENIIHRRDFLRAYDKGFGYNLAEQFDAVKAKRDAGDKTWRADFRGVERCADHLSYLAPRRPDLYHALTRAGRDFLTFADMMTDYRTDIIKKRLDGKIPDSPAYHLQCLYHLYGSTVDNPAIPESIKEAFGSRFAREAENLYAFASGGASLESFMQIRKKVNALGLDRINPRMPVTPRRQVMYLQGLYRRNHPAADALPA